MRPFRFIPAYLVTVMSGLSGLAGVLPAAAVCGVVFAGVQFLVSNLVGPYLTDIVASTSAIFALVVFVRFWQPAKQFQYQGEVTLTGVRRHSTREVALAWMPYGFLVIFVLLWGFGPVKALSWAEHHCAIRVAEASQPGDSQGASRNCKFALSGCLHLQLANSIRYRLHVRRVGIGSGAAILLGRCATLFIDTARKRSFHADHRGRTRIGVRDEFLRGNHITGARVRADRCAVSFLQSVPRLVGSLPHWQRHIGECVV